MKKLLKKIILSTACATALAIGLVGCGDNIITPQTNNEDNNNGGDTTASVGQTVTSPLRFDSKYYSGIDGPMEERNYWTFSENGTGKYYFYLYYEYSGKIEIDNYTIDFNYVYTNADKTQVTCFYNGVTYTAKDNQKAASTSWWRTLNVSENVLLSEGQYGYTLMGINEEYLKQIPNFGKKTDSRNK